MQMHEILKREKHVAKARSFYAQLFAAGHFSEEAFLGYLAGMWVTDGSCCIGLGGRRRLLFCQSNPTYLHALGDRLAELFGITFSIYGPRKPSEAARK